MAKLFAFTGSTGIPALPEPYDFPTSTDTISAQSKGTKAAAVSLSGTDSLEADANIYRVVYFDFQGSGAAWEYFT